MRRDALGETTVRRASHEAGFSLVELIVSASLLALVMAGASRLLGTAHRGAKDLGRSLSEQTVLANLANNLGASGHGIAVASLGAVGNETFRTCVATPGSCPASHATSPGAPFVVMSPAGARLAGTSTAPVRLNARFESVGCENESRATASCPHALSALASVTEDALSVKVTLHSRGLDDSAPLRSKSTPVIAIPRETLTSGGSWGCESPLVLVGTRSDGTPDCKSPSSPGLHPVSTCFTAWATSTFTGAVSPGASAVCACGGGTTHMIESASQTAISATTDSGVGSTTCMVVGQGSTGVYGLAWADAHDGPSSLHGWNPVTHALCGFTCLRYVAP